MILGVDVFHGYGDIDWAEAYAGGVRFAYMKCTEGNESRRNDPAFSRNVAGARAAGILVGAYHFAYPLPPAEGKTGRSPREQAQRAYADSGALGTGFGELPPAIDAEWPEVGDWGKWGCSAPQLSAWFREFCEAAAELWGRKPLIYTYPFWWRTLANAADVSWAAEYPLWLATYTHPGPGLPPERKRPEPLRPWTECLFWQFSAKGSAERVPGVPACPVDRDAFLGSYDDLCRLANVPPSEPPPLVDWEIVTRLPGSDDGPPDAA